MNAYELANARKLLTDYDYTVRKGEHWSREYEVYDNEDGKMVASVSRLTYTNAADRYEAVMHGGNFWPRSFHFNNAASGLIMISTLLTHAVEPQCLWEDAV